MNPVAAAVCGVTCICTPMIVPDRVPHRTIVHHVHHVRHVHRVHPIAKSTHPIHPKPHKRRKHKAHHPAPAIVCDCGMAPDTVDIGGGGSDLMPVLDLSLTPLADFGEEADSTEYAGDYSGGFGAGGGYAYGGEGTGGLGGGGSGLGGGGDAGLPTGGGSSGVGSGTTNPVGGVPETSTWCMMLLGFGFVGYSIRRRSVKYG